MKDKGFLGHIHPALKLLALAMLSFISLAIITFIGIIFAFIFFDSSVVMQMLEGDMDLMQNIEFGKYVQMLSHVGMFVVPALLFAFLVGKNINKYLSVNKKPDMKQVFLGICLVIASFPFIGFLLEINMKLSLPEFMAPIERWIYSSEEAAQMLTDKFLSVTTIKGLIINILVIAVLPAFGEEFIFRGALMRTLKQWTNNAHLAVWLSAIIFSAIHIQFLGFLPRLFLGALFGYMVIYSGSLWIAIIAHFVNNAVAVVAFYFYHNNYTNVQLEEISKGQSGIIYTIISIMLITLLMYAYWRIGRINEEKLIISEEETD